MGSIKDRNGTDLKEAEDINKRWKEYTEELYKKDLNDLDNHNGVITHLEPHIHVYIYMYMYIYTHTYIISHLSLLPPHLIL